MVTAAQDSIASRGYNWYSQVPQVMKGDNTEVFKPTYIILPAPEPEVGFFETRFADLPSAGIWADRTESDDELLEELSSGWRGFATEQ